MRALRRVRRNPRSLFAALALLSVGALLLFIQFMLDGKWYAAAAIPPLSFAGAYVLLKASVAASVITRVSRQGIMSRTPSPESMAAATRGATHSADELSLIGTYTPEKSDLGLRAGRGAAAVDRDPRAPYRLFAATHGYGGALQQHSDQRRVAVIAPKETGVLVDGHAESVSLHPSVALAELSYHLPDTIVIDEEANQAGPWAGFLEPSGAQLLEEVRGVTVWAADNNVSVLLLPARGTAAIAAPVLRRMKLQNVGDSQSPAEHEGLFAELSALGGQRRGEAK